MGQGLLVVRHRAEIAYIKPAAASFTFPKMTGVAWRRALPADEVQRPAEETPRLTPQEGNTNFDGAWIFTSAGCRHTGSLPAMITGGKIVVRGGSGQVDPDGTLHSVGAGNGMTLTAVGRLSGNTGAGTFSRSDGCVGSWIAIKH
jgi:hypothetical protein